MQELGYWVIYSLLWVSCSMWSNHQATARKNGCNWRYLKIQNNRKDVKYFLACLQHNASSFLQLRVDIFGLHNMKNFSHKHRLHLLLTFEKDLACFTFTAYDIKWWKIKQAKSSSNVNKRCNLCLWEKFFILCRPEMSTLNCRNDLALCWRHARNFLLKNVFT